MKSFIRNSITYGIWCALREIFAWRGRGYAAPSPHFIKQACLVRNGFTDAVWVETGTFLGQTTHFLSKRARHVYSIEPEPTLYANAVTRFKKNKNISLLHATSESALPMLLAKINGDTNFWLDGHYSAGITFKGKQDTPIIDELKCIGANLNRLSRVCVLIDDIRCFDPSLPGYENYPPLSVLIDWATQHRLSWHIEHDIFVAKTPSSHS